jgi:hypothetical protein
VTSDATVETERRIERVCVATGPALAALYGLGVILFARMIPVNSPARSVAAVVAAYRAHANGIRIGMAMVVFGAALMITWAAAVATQTRRGSPGHPILFHIQMACAVTACINGVMLCLAGGLAAFRPDVVPGESIRMLNDLFWLLWTIPGTSFEVWCFAAAAAILIDKRANPVFPRWAGYFSIFVGCSFLPGVLAFFAKHGPIAYNGLIPWWIPTVTFFSWVIVMTPLTWRAIDREVDEPAVEQIADPAVIAEFARLRAEIAARDSAAREPVDVRSRR